MSAGPFQSFLVEPSFGSFSAVVSFRMLPGMGGDVYIYRSMNGATGWKLLNPEAPVAVPEGLAGAFAAQDMDAGFDGTPYYRGVLDPDGGAPSTWIKGPAIAPFEHLTRRQRTRSSMILKREYRKMAGRNGSGTQVIHLIPLEDGETVSRYDKETGQLLGPSCPAASSLPEELSPMTDEWGYYYRDANGFTYLTNGPGSDQGYGTRFRGGYYPPLQAWVRILQVQPQSDESPEGTSEEQKAGVVLRFLAHPRPREGHLIILPQSDRRYVVADPVKPYYFPGTMVPIAWEGPAELLDPKDIRYRIPLGPTSQDPRPPMEAGSKNT